MRNRLAALLLALIVSLFLSQWLLPQDVHPTRGQPQGGDRRGSYYGADKEGDEEYEKTNGSITRLYQDPKVYLHNMTLLAHVSPANRGFGEGGMMTVGGNRYLFSGGVAVDVTDPKHPIVVNDKAPGGELAYNKSLQKWILMRADSCCNGSPAVLEGKKPHPQLNPPKGRTYGATFFDVTDPRNIVELSKWQTPPGMVGTHGDGNFYDGGRYAYLSASLPGLRGQPPFQEFGRILQILDLSDIKNPKEVSTWWVPGQKKTEETEFLKWPEAPGMMATAGKPWTPDMRYYFANFHGPCMAPKRVEDGGNRAYCAYSAFGLRILDLTDIRQPKEVSSLDPSPPFEMGIPVHSVYPMLDRKLVFMNGETIKWDCNEGVNPPFVVDIRAEKYPMVIATFPIPKPPKEAPYNDFCFRGGRFGIHGPQEFKAPGEARLDLMGYAWFQGGFWLYDVSNPFRPEEVAWIVPAQGNRRGTEGSFIEWDRKIIYVFSDTGLYILSSPALGEPVLAALPPERWNPPGLNAGAP